MEKNGNNNGCLSFLSPSFQTQQKVNLLVSISLFSDNTKLKVGKDNPNCSNNIIFYLTILSISWNIFKLC